MPPQREHRHGVAVHYGLSGVVFSARTAGWVLARRAGLREATTQRARYHLLLDRRLANGPRYKLQIAAQPEEWQRFLPPDDPTQNLCARSSHRRRLQNLTPGVAPQACGSDNHSSSPREDFLCRFTTGPESMPGPFMVFTRPG